MIHVKGAADRRYLASETLQAGRVCGEAVDTPCARKGLSNGSACAQVARPLWMDVHKGWPPWVVIGRTRPDEGCAGCAAPTSCAGRSSKELTITGGRRTLSEYWARHQGPRARVVVEAKCSRVHFCQPSPASFLLTLAQVSTGYHPDWYRGCRFCDQLLGGKRVEKESAGQTGPTCSAHLRTVRDAAARPFALLWVTRQGDVTP